MLCFWHLACPLMDCGAVTHVHEPSCMKTLFLKSKCWPSSECCFSLPVRISSITLWIASLEIGLVIDVDYHFGNRLGIGLVIAPSITKIVTGLEIRTTITRMVTGGNQTRNGSLDYQNGNWAGNQDCHYQNGNWWKSNQEWFL